MFEQRNLNLERVRAFLEEKAVERFIVDQFFRDGDEEDLLSAVLRVRAYERVNLYIRGTYEQLCAFLGLEQEESHTD